MNFHADQLLHLKPSLIESFEYYCQFRAVDHPNVLLIQQCIQQLRSLGDDYPSILKIPAILYELDNNLSANQTHYISWFNLLAITMSDSRSIIHDYLKSCALSPEIEKEPCYQPSDEVDECKDALQTKINEFAQSGSQAYFAYRLLFVDSCISLDPVLSPADTFDDFCEVLEQKAEDALCISVERPHIVEPFSVFQKLNGEHPLTREPLILDRIPRSLFSKVALTYAWRLALVQKLALRLSVEQRQDVFTTDVLNVILALPDHFFSSTVLPIVVYIHAVDRHLLDKFLLVQNTAKLLHRFYGATHQQVHKLLQLYKQLTDEQLIQFDQHLDGFTEQQLQAIGIEQLNDHLVAILVTVGQYTKLPIQQGKRISNL